MMVSLVTSLKEKVMRCVNIKKLLSTAAVFLIFLAATCLLGPINSSNTAGAAGLVYAKASQPGSARGELIYSYQYFPALQVYYDPAREVYFYQADGKWVKSPVLQGDMKNRLGDFIVLHLNVKDPYELHSQVVAQYPPKPSEIVRESTGSPPLRSSEAQGEIYQYHYYPASEVYFDPERRFYFYETDGKWNKSPELPAHLRRPGDFIVVEMTTPNPFEFNSQVENIDMVETERLSREMTHPPTWEPVGSEPVYHYRYYPSASVYFDMDRKLYFYLSKGSWTESPTLPDDIAKNLGPSAVVHMKTGTPYVYHSEVAEMYPHPAGKLSRSVYMIWKQGFVAR
jgi:hypothetical protein